MCYHYLSTLHVRIIYQCLPLDLSLLLLLIGDSVGQGRVDHGLHPDVAPDANADSEEDNAGNLKRNGCNYMIQDWQGPRFFFKKKKTFNEFFYILKKQLKTTESDLSSVPRKKTIRIQPDTLEIRSTLNFLKCYSCYYNYISIYRKDKVFSINMS